MVRHLELKYNENLCHCLQTFFVNESNLLAKELLRITNYKDNNCIKSMVDPNKYYNIWITLPKYVESEFKQKLIYSQIMRKKCNQNTVNLNFNYTEDLYLYMQQLLTELSQYVNSSNKLEEVENAHRNYYADLYQQYVSNSALYDEYYFYDYINPLFKFNFNMQYANPWPCIFQNKLKVFFIPNINNIIKHAPIE